jgi:hypothetical protein
MTTLRIDHEVHTYNSEVALDDHADVPPKVFATLCPAANPPTTFQHRSSVLMGASIAPDQEGRQT